MTVKIISVALSSLASKLCDTIRLFKKDASSLRPGPRSYTEQGARGLAGLVDAHTSARDLANSRFVLTKNPWHILATGGPRRGRSTARHEGTEEAQRLTKNACVECTSFFDILLSHTLGLRKELRHIRERTTSFSKNVTIMNE